MGSPTNLLPPPQPWLFPIVEPSVGPQTNEFFRWVQQALNWVMSSSEHHFELGVETGTQVLTSQGVMPAQVGQGAAGPFVKIYSFPLVAGAIDVGKTAIIVMVFKHTAGAAAVNYQLFFGNTLVFSFSTADNTHDLIAVVEVMNLDNTQQQQVAFARAYAGTTLLATSAIFNMVENTALPIVVRSAFQAANTESVRGTLFTLRRLP